MDADRLAMGALQKTSESNNIDYQALEQGRAAEIQAEMRKKLASQIAARGNTLRHDVLQLVVENQYERAIEEMELYVEVKQKYPLFVTRVGTYLEHCRALIHAIEAKRQIQGSSVLSLAKQQELYETVSGHFEELKHYLKQIERVEGDVRSEDQRSTVWVIKALVQGMFVIFFVGLFLDLYGGMGQSFVRIFDLMVLSLVDAFFSLF